MYLAQTLPLHRGNSGTASEQSQRKARQKENSQNSEIKEEKGRILAQLMCNCVKKVLIGKTIYYR